MRTQVSVSVLAIAAGAVFATDSVNPDGNADGNADGDLDITTRVEVASEMPAPAFAHAPRGPGAGIGEYVFTGSDPEGDAPSDIVFTPDGETIIIAHRESGNLILWDADTRAFVGEVAISGAPQALDVTPDGLTAVVSSINTETVSIVDLTTLAESAVINVGNVPASVSISDDGTRAAVHCAFDGTTYIIDIPMAGVERTIPGIDTWSTLSFSGEAPAVNVQYGGPEFIDTTRLINVDLGADEVQFIDAATGAVNRLAVADSPRSVSISGDGTTAVVVHSFASRTLTVIDVASETVTGTFSTTFDMWGPIAVNTDATRAIVGIQNAAQMIDLTTGLNIGFALDTASNNDLTATFDGQYAVSTGFRGSVIDFATASLVTNANNAVSCDVGAVSPVDYRAAMCSTTFGDDLVVVNTDGGGGAGLEAFQLSGPLEEGDRCRTAAISADGATAVGVSIFSDTLTIIDTATNTVTGHAPLGQRPSGVAITPDGTKAVVANLDSSFASVVDLANATTTNINISRRAGEVEISPDGAYAYLAVVADGDGVWRINLNTMAVEGFKLPTGNMGGVGYSYSQTSGIALSADGAWLAVAGSFDDRVTLIDTAMWTVAHNISVSDFPTYVEFSADGTRLYVSIKNEDKVEIIALNQPVPAVVATVPTVDQPWHLVADSTGQYVYVNGWGGDHIQVIDTTIPAVLGNYFLHSKATGLHLDEDAGLVYFPIGSATTTLGGEFGYTHTEAGSLNVAETPFLLPVASHDLGCAPSAIAFDASSRFGVAACPQADGAVIIALNGPCNPADIAEPFGTLDLADIQAFIAAFLVNDPAADLAPPAGVWDLADLQAFVIAFGGGCP